MKGPYSAAASGATNVAPICVFCSPLSFRPKQYVALASHCFSDFFSFNVVAPCMAADFALLAESLMANGALQTLSQTYSSIQNDVLPY